MRIALIAEDYYPQLGGVPEHVHHLALQLNAWGHDTTVITSHMRGAHRDAPFVRRVGTSLVVYANGGVSRITLGWRLGHRLEDLFRAGRYDLVHVQGRLVPTFGLLAPLAAWRVGIPVVATFHSWFPRSAGYRVLRRLWQSLLDRHAALIAVSQPVVDAMSRYFRARWEIIPNGVDVQFFQPNGRRPTDALARGPRLLFLARLEPRNGLDTLLQAMPRILERHPRARLTVVGDGPWRGYYERRARALGRRRRGRRARLRRVRAERPTVRPGDRARATRRPSLLPHVRRRAQPDCHGADSPHTVCARRARGVLPRRRARAPPSRPGAPHRRGRARAGKPHPTPREAAPARAAPHPRRARRRPPHDRRCDRPGGARVPRTARLPQSVRRARGARPGVPRVRVDVRGVGLRSAGGGGDPPAGAAQALSRRDRPTGRRRRLRPRRRPHPDRRRAAGHHRGRARGGLRVPPTRGAHRVSRRAWLW